MWLLFYSMKNLSGLGRVCYGVSIAVLGFLTLAYRDLPYMMVPPGQSWLNGFSYILGTLILLAGLFIAVGKKIKLPALVLGTALMAFFCLFLVDAKNYHHFGDGENAAKELALAAGAFIVAGARQWRVVYALTIISFSIDHFLYAHEAADYVPSWMPAHVTCLYVTGAALFCAGLAIIINVRIKLAATLLGAMILTWFVILHVPRIAMASRADLSGEVASAMLALAYGGIAWVIAGTADNVRAGA